MDGAQILDKAQGALIGSALGDAIGIFTGKPDFQGLEGEYDTLTGFVSRVHEPRAVYRSISKCNLLTGRSSDRTSSG
jgi:ADP-ribosylglycohydrolase